jgi:hypothetical protein
VDVDLIDARLDPFNQGSEDRTRARRWQLGPLPRDLRGARDKPLLGKRFWGPCRGRIEDAAGIEKPLAHLAHHELLDLSAS